MTATISNLVPAVILPSLRVGSRKQAIQELAIRLGQQAGLDSRAMVDILNLQTDHGGIGRGLAIPHARIPGLMRTMVGFARLHQPIDFDAIDGQPVDLVFVLVAPDNQKNDFLTSLARLTRFLREPEMPEKLRGAVGPDALQAVLMTIGQSPQAA